MPTGTKHRRVRLLCIPSKIFIGTLYSFVDQGLLMPIILGMEVQCCKAVVVQEDFPKLEGFLCSSVSMTYYLKFHFTV